MSHVNPSRGSICGSSILRKPAGTPESVAFTIPLASSPLPGTYAPMKIAFCDRPVTGSNATRVPLMVAGWYRRGAFAGS